MVDDNRLVRELIVGVLEEAGFRVRAAARGREALEQAAQEDFRLAVIDVAMPEMDGWQLAGELAAGAGPGGLPILFLAQDRGRPPLLGQFPPASVEILPKPFTAEELLARVRLLLPAAASALHAEKSPLSGNTSHLPVADLVQLLALNRRTGCLHLEGRNPGRIHVRQGQVMEAFTGRVHGRKALYRMLGWEEAEFRFDPRDSAAFGAPLGPAPERLLMEGLVAQDEMRVLRPRLPAGDAPLGLAEGVRDLLSRAAEVTPVQAAVLRQVRRGLTLDELFDQIDLPDLEVARAVLHLFERGALAEVNGEDQAR